MQEITVRVPASTSNLGPGFDCLGVALRIYNDVTVARGASRQHLHPRIVSDAANRFSSSRAGVRFPFPVQLQKTFRGRAAWAAAQPFASVSYLRSIVSAVLRSIDSRFSDYVPNWKDIPITLRRQRLVASP